MSMSLEALCALNVFVERIGGQRDIVDESVVV